MILLYGALTLAAQVIFLREFLLLARGNELYLGLGLWTWLAWTGLGSLWGGRLGTRTAIRWHLLAQLLVVLAVLLPFTILVARALPTLLGWYLGVAPSFGRLAFWFAVLSGPFCLLSGLFFPLACRWLQEHGPSSGLVGRAYGWDALGMGFGGLLLTILLLGKWDSLWLGLGGCLGVLLLLNGLLLLRWRSHRLWLTAVTLVVLLGVLLAVYVNLPALTRRWQWPQRTVLAVAETPLSVWTATREAEQISFAGNGVWFFTYPDPQTAEEQVHVALLQHPEPKTVLLLGGGVAGLVAEILRTPSLARLDYVELDAGLVELAKQVLPPGAWQPLTDTRVNLVVADGRRWVRQSRETYDVILLSLPEPSNVLLNRFYSRDFYREIKDRLKPGGVFSFGLPGSETALSPARRSSLRLAVATLQEVFPEVVVFPGLTWRFFASPQPQSLTDELDTLLERQRMRQLSLLYVREYYLRAQLSPGRLAQVQQLLRQPTKDINTDAQPLGLLYGLILAGQEAESFLPTILNWLRERGSSSLYLALALLTLGIWLGSGYRCLPSRRLPSFYSVFAMGAAMMGLEMVILIIFQLTLGYLYGQMSLLLAAFMAGLAGGSFLASHVFDQGLSPRRLGLTSQAGLAVFLAMLGLSLPWLLTAPWFQAEVWGQLGFILLLGVGGLLGGSIFAAQAEVSRQAGTASVQGAGWLYAIDLLGATVGTLGVGFLLIPCFGPGQALLFVAALQGSAWLVQVAARGNGRGHRLFQDGSP